MGRVSRDAGPRSETSPSAIVIFDGESGILVLAAWANRGYRSHVVMRFSFRNAMRIFSLPSAMK